MKKRISIAVILSIFCFPLFSQDKIETSAEKDVTVGPNKPSVKPNDTANKNIPVQSLYSELLEIQKVYFNKKIDPTGTGDLLEVEFEVTNKIDDPQDIYLFVIATFEKSEKTNSSLEAPIPEKERLRSFVPYPEDISNFEYTDFSGKAKLLKQPKNTKAGVDPATGKAYHLKEKLFIRTNHLAKYRNNYYYFNMVMILAFNSSGEPIFRQQYKIHGIRR
jgi:hypothetical protein